MRKRVIPLTLLALSAAAATVLLVPVGGCEKRRRQQLHRRHRYRARRLPHRRHRHLRQQLPRKASAWRWTRSTRPACWAGARSRSMTDDDRSLPDEAKTATEQADQPGQGRRHSRRDRLQPLDRDGAGRAGQPDPDALPRQHQPQGDRGRRLHLPRLLHRPLPGHGRRHASRWHRSRKAWAEAVRDPLPQQQRLRRWACASSSPTP